MTLFGKALIAIVLVAVGGGVYLALQTGDDENIAQPTENPDETADAFTGNGTFADLMRMSRTAECTVTYTDEKSIVNGTAYIAGERVRGDFTIDHEDGTFESHFIHEGTRIYSWTRTPAGMVALVIDENQNGESGAQESVQPIQVDQRVDYNCVAWNADESVFTPPADIEFKTQAELMQGMMMGADGEAVPAQCPMCNNVSDPAAKEQCLITFGCE